MAFSSFFVINILIAIERVATLLFFKKVNKGGLCLCFEVKKKVEVLRIMELVLLLH